MDFAGRTALVTGGASGIGFAVARQLAELGAKIAIADIDIDAAQAAASRLPGAEVMIVQVDVRDPEDAANMIGAVVAKYGKLDILVHSAGVGIEKGFLETTAEEWQRLIDIDLSGTFYCAQAAARHMVDNGYGRIINLASTAGIRGGTGRTAYGAAKGGVITLTRVMAVELAAYGVTANALAPGAIETELVARMHSEETRRVFMLSDLTSTVQPDLLSDYGVGLADIEAIVSQSSCKNNPVTLEPDEMVEIVVSRLS